MEAFLFLKIKGKTKVFFFELYIILRILFEMTNF